MIFDRDLQPITYKAASGFSISGRFRYSAAMPSRKSKPRPGTQYRTIVPCKYAKAGSRRTGAVRLWAFSVADLGVLFDRGDEWVRVLIRQGRLDPTDLQSICDIWWRVRGSKGDLA